MNYKIPLAKELNEQRHISFRRPTLCNDIPKGFKVVSYFRYCRLYKNYLIEHLHVL